ncbi:MAG: hypothetical protein A2X48_15100 [Lentisphaerae bacterium GWF2_49_21]|nr:MAG: hypothetical protein A2X48_15100 [Lentisphaerae bacterium GWF2_49_21]
MKILLTGAAGNLGSTVCRKLYEEGFEIVATDQHMRKDLPVKLQVADLTDRIVCYGLMEGADAIVHLAAHPNDGLPIKQDLLNDNLSITMNLLHAAWESGINKFLSASSVQAMTQDRRMADDGTVPKSSLKYLPLDGEAPANPGNVYGLSKQLCEELLSFYAREKGMSCIAFRFPFLFNPEYLKYYRRYRMSWKIYVSQQTNLEECFAALSVNDSARLISAVLKADISGYRCYYPASPIPVINESIPVLLKKYYKGVELRKPLAELKSLVDISKITKETGWTPEDNVYRMIKEGLKEKA